MLLLACMAVAVGAHPPPPPPPLPTVMFNDSLNDNMVLQREPQTSAVYGSVKLSTPPGNVNVSVVVYVDSGLKHSIIATIDPKNASHWYARIPPMPTGGNVTITASCLQGCDNSSDTASLYNVTYGDVYLCNGQSNMWLPMEYTFARNKTLAALKNGKYSNIRIRAPSHGRYSGQEFVQVWKTAKAAGLDTDPYGYFGLFQFASTCYYFGESLTDLLEARGQEIPPIGLINLAIGGTQIEAWTSQVTQAECNNITQTDGGLYESWIVPYSYMSVKGFIWYQGENDMHEMKGNILNSEGYACMMPKLLSSWRKLFSENGDNSPDAPFGVVTLAPGGGEGGANIATMRWAQTANFGVIPNPAMQNAYVVQAFDLGEPWDGLCPKFHCCAIWGPTNKTICEGALGVGALELCATECNAYEGTHQLMSGIHPRLKKPLGDRLAQGMHALVYPDEYTPDTPLVGPYLAGCALDMSKQELIITFNSTMLAKDFVFVQDYNKTVTQSAMEALPGTNSTSFCMEPLTQCLPFPNGTRPVGNCGHNGFEYYCPVDLETNNLKASVPDYYDMYWTALNITAGPSPYQVTVDLTPLNGTAPAGIRYAWLSNDCCKGRLFYEPCNGNSCPIIANTTRLPANPFMARIVNGKCQCVAPQNCSSLNSFQQVSPNLCQMPFLHAGVC
eukprot:m.112529 g.112529  ORF g.112529 m.112529 type:complete len:672 (-) comp14091_c0_seq2:383-2398(-)